MYEVIQNAGPIIDFFLLHFSIFIFKLKIGNFFLILNQFKQNFATFNILNLFHLT